nr:putative per os infectivity factor PIF1 [Microplitis mediator]
MDIVTLLLITVFICLVVKNISKYDPSTDKNPIDAKNKTTSVLEELKKLDYNFKTDIQMESPAGDNVRINIVDPCDPADKNKRKTCTISDPISCNSCPYTTCTHFETDTLIGNTTIPRNLNKDLGYCISSNDLSQDCNKYHGDWVMIKASAYNKDNDNANDYIRFCLCKKPGFIGNRTLFGNCSTPFICDGEVEDINVDYKSIKCQCFDEYYSTNVGDDGRICKAPTVSKRVNWSNVPKPLKFKDSYIKVRDYYNHNVQGDVNQLDELIDPCSICPITGQLTYGESITIENSDPAKTTVICRPSNNNPGEIGNFGIPVRREFKDNKRLLKGSWGPDAMLAIQWDELWVYDSDGEGEHKGSKQLCVFKFRFNKYNRAFYEKFEINRDSQCAIESHKDALLGLTVLPKSSFMTTVKVECSTIWVFSWNCSLTHGSRIGEITADQLVVQLMNNNLHEVVSTYIGSTRVEPGWNFADLADWDNIHEVRVPFSKAAITFDDVDYNYLTYNHKFFDIKLLNQINYGAMRITPLTKEQRAASSWTGHQSGTRHYEVFFVSVKPELSHAVSNVRSHTIVL